MPPSAPPHTRGNTAALGLFYVTGTDFSVFVSCLVFENMHVTVMFLQEYHPLQLNVTNADRFSSYVIWNNKCVSLLTVQYSNNDFKCTISNRTLNEIFLLGVHL